MPDDYLIKSVDVVGQEVDDLSSGRLGKRSAVQTKSLHKNKGVNTLKPNVTQQHDDSRKHPRAHLPIDHVTQGHADLHPDPLDVVEIEMMKDSEGEGQQRDACSVHVGVVDPGRAGGVGTLEEPDDLPEQHRLNDLDDFLIRKIVAVTEGSDASKQHFTAKSSVPPRTCTLR